MGTATGGVGNDPIGPPEGVEIAPREFTRGVEVAVVRRQRAAARLTWWNDDAPPVPSEDADRRAVHRSVPSVLHAARQQRDRSLRRTARLRDPRERTRQLRQRR